MSPPKTSFTREDVIGAALALVEEDGLDALTARAVAARLGSSVAPIYKQFGSVGELVDAVMDAAAAQLMQATRTGWTNDSFLNMGTGIAVFARDHANLYRALFLEGDRFRAVLDDFVAGMKRGMHDDPTLAELPAEAREQMLETMWVVTHGQASLMAAGLVDDTRLEAIVQFLLHVGGAVSLKTILELGIPFDAYMERAAEFGPPQILMEDPR